MITNAKAEELLTNLLGGITEVLHTSLVEIWEEICADGYC